MTAKYTLAPLPVAVVPDGYTYSAVISQGGSYTIKAKVYPDYAANKKVVWSIASAPEGATGVTVSSKGVVKAAKNATPGVCGVIIWFNKRQYVPVIGRYSYSGTFS